VAITEYQTFMKDRKLKVHFGPTHYHLHAACIAAKNADCDATADLIIAEADKKAFTDAHNCYIDKEFKM